MQQTPKQDWIQYIQNILAGGHPFHRKVTGPNKIFILFAADTFRRSGHEVTIDIVPTESHISCLIVTIFPTKSFIEFTLRRNNKPTDIIQQITDSQCTQVSLRGCGTVINTLFQIMDWSLHHGWYVEKTTMSTLTQQKETYQQRNTTLNIVIRKG
jgi:hypothetical protein